MVSLLVRTWTRSLRCPVTKVWTPNNPIPKPPGFTPGMKANKNIYQLDDALMKDVRPTLARALGPEMMLTKEKRFCELREMRLKYCDMENYGYVTLMSRIAKITFKINVLQYEIQKPRPKKFRESTHFLKYDQYLWKRNRMLKLLKQEDLEGYKRICRELDIRELKRNATGDPALRHTTRESIPNAKMIMPLRDLDYRHERLLPPVNKPSLNWRNVRTKAQRGRDSRTVDERMRPRDRPFLMKNWREKQLERDNQPIYPGALPLYPGAPR